ncbi:unnamed protein product [Nippostrongylus brasiliensis]|uniref:AKAP2_C domain-containing protein n=1 Tax=Nippostrongylus brasiliensis TaxID=27835 RepID=A0A158R101_NIPBR|nr:unnamed protein product [Nippostrongylus brasiliensis]
MDPVSKAPPAKPHRVIPVETSSPQGAWQEEESLEVYRRKRTQKPHGEGVPEIVRFVKRHPKSATDEVYETVAPPARDDRREIILLEPVQEVGSPDKDPIYVPVEKTVEKTEEHDQTRDAAECAEVVVEECLSPTREIETYSFMREHHKETVHDGDTTSVKERPGATPTPFEVCSYRPPNPPDTDVAEDVERMERISSEERERSGKMVDSHHEREERNGGTPLLDRTIYYEREVVGEKTPDRVSRQSSYQPSRQPSRQTLLIDEDISQLNRRVDTVLREQAPRSPQPSIRSSIPERRTEGRSSSEELTRMRREQEKSERIVDAPRGRGSNGLEEPPSGGGRTSRTSERMTDYQKYERKVYGMGHTSKKEDQCRGKELFGMYRFIPSRPERLLATTHHANALSRRKRNPQARRVSMVLTWLQSPRSSPQSDSSASREFDDDFLPPPSDQYR